MNLFDNQLCFKPTGNIVVVAQNLRVAGIVWGDTVLYCTAKYYEGNLFTEMHAIRAKALIPDSTTIQVVTKGTRNILNRPDILQPVTMDMSCNNFGYFYSSSFLTRMLRKSVCNALQ